MYVPFIFFGTVHHRIRRKKIWQVAASPSHGFIRSVGGSHTCFRLQNSGLQLENYPPPLSCCTQVGVWLTEVYDTEQLSSFSG